MRVAPSLVVFVAACSEFEISKQPEPEEILTPDIVVDPPSIDFGMVSSGGFEVRTVTILGLPHRLGHRLQRRRIEPADHARRR